ncbi:ABC transporter ATP-binding protein [Membranihabitans marinus]|uniref:ABC transporter ATP-binding protein n=1 Tax=Membranihabitans marinus TaxID=1227546 RepID=UPI001EFFBD5B|nr:ATP-binding cassette domain-containing protein [Membranihabitans marinus]
MKLTTKDISIQYQDQNSIKYPDIELNSGDKVLLKGPSGCGKSSLLYALSNIIPVHRGQVLLDGNDISNLSIKDKDSFRSQHFGLIFQEPRFLYALTVYENIELAATYQSKMSKKEIMDLVQSLNLTGIAHKKIGHISTGERQRTAIARTLVQRPTFILADEPTSALDDRHCNDVIELLIHTSAAINAGLIVASHDHRLDPYFPSTIQLI